MSAVKRQGGEGEAQVGLVLGEAEAHTSEDAAGRAPSLVELLLAQEGGSPPALASRIDGIVIGRIAGMAGGGAARVTFAGAPPEGFTARTMTPLREEDTGCEVALMFESGDPLRPAVMGKVVSPLAAGAAGASSDGRRVEINAEEEIVLRCGEASITLTRAGKILLRGAYVLSRSSGVNRIQGGSVEIN